MPADADMQNLFLFLTVISVVLIFVSLFYHPDQEKRPHKAAISLMREFQRKKAKSKYLKEETRKKLISRLNNRAARTWQRCANCGTGSPQWQNPQLLDLTDIRRTVIISVTAQTCQKCGHVQLFGADWLHSQSE